jgi:nucleoid-associated protein YgaU
MKTKLVCPVCDRPDIEGDICPNCETNLSTFRMLAELPIVEANNSFRPKMKTWLSVAIAMLLLVGISLGATGSYLLSKQQLEPISTSVSSSRSISIQQTNSSQSKSIATSSTQPCVSNLSYTVRRGDSLSLVASRFYGNEQDWQVIIKANPQLQGRENSLEIGEKFLLPKLYRACS